MAQYSVPQFVEIEDKIIGPLTLKQFFVFMGGSGVVFFMYRFFDNIIFFILTAIPVAIVTIALSFGTFNGRPLGSAIISLAHFASNPRSFVFRKEADFVPVVRQATTKMVSSSPTMTNEERLSRLHKLTYILDQERKEEEELLKEKFLNVK